MAANFLTKLGLLKTSKQEMIILDDVSGVLKPGRLTLLLGPPSAGKSTLLKALAGKLRGVQVCPPPFPLLSPLLTHTTVLRPPARLLLGV